MRIKRAVHVLLRAALLRYVRAQPRRADASNGERRVLILLTTAWAMGGAVRTNLNLAGYLAERYEVEVISVLRRRGRTFFEPPPRVRVVDLDPGPRATPRVLRLVRRVLRRRSGVLIDPGTPGSRGLNLWAELRLVHRLRRRCGFLITVRPAQNLLAARMSPPGLVLIGEENMNLRKRPAELREAMPTLYPMLDALVVLTEQDRQAYEAHLDGRVRVVRIPNAVRDMGAGMADLSSVTVLAAGRLTRQKGFDLLIRGFARVAAEHPGWRLRICGGGRLRTKLEALVVEQGLSEVVTLAGPVRDLGAEMSRASIFVLSSRFEGLPLVLLEAMSKGMAVVSADCPTGPAEVLQDRRNGILVPRRDADALGDAIVELIRDEDLRHRCAAGAVETAREYTMTAVGRQWEALLGELRSSRGRGCETLGPGDRSRFQRVAP
jgi:glycosyltransferase involved in cell wall biosynthesis